MSPEDDLSTHDERKTSKRMKEKQARELKSNTNIPNLSRVEWASWSSFDCHFKDELHTQFLSSLFAGLNWKIKRRYNFSQLSNNTPITLKNKQ